MIRKLLRDESGMTMGLVILMIALIGVMGAGLLTFVQRDLNAVVEVNRGQQAFEAADAGIQAAKRQLLADATTGGAGRRDLSFDGRNVNVRIQYLPAEREPIPPTQDQAPELIPQSAPDGQRKPPSGCRFFKVTSDASVGGARRRIEAILCAKQLGFPTAYYTPKSIGFEGEVKVSGVSFFAGGNITGTNSGNVTIDRATEALYRNWDSRKFTPKSKYNTTPRKGTGVGFGAEGMVCKDEACTTSAADGTNDFDSTTLGKGETKAQFIRKSTPEAPQTPSEITYPFDTDTSQLVRFLEDEARRQGNYYGAPQNIGSTTTGGKARYPENSTDQTVFFMDAQGQTIDIGYSVDYEPKARGTLVIKNGNLRIDDSSNGFDGVIIVTGDGTTTGKYQGSAKNTMKGFAIADGDITIRGTVAPFTTDQDLTERPGFYGVDIWSWRELYE